jgi:hypothetical protein
MSIRSATANSGNILSPVSNVFWRDSAIAKANVSGREVRILPPDHRGGCTATTERPRHIRREEPAVRYHDL